MDIVPCPGWDPNSWFQCSSSLRQWGPQRTRSPRWTLLQYLRHKSIAAKVITTEHEIVLLWPSRMEIFSALKLHVSRDPLHAACTPRVGGARLKAQTPTPGQRPANSPQSRRGGQFFRSNFQTPTAHYLQAETMPLLETRTLLFQGVKPDVVRLAYLQSTDVTDMVYNTQNVGVWTKTLNTECYKPL
jgi:hypothetical protein